MRAHPRAGDGPLRGGRRSRRRYHRTGLGPGERGRRPAGVRPRLRQTELRQGTVGARGARGRAVPFGPGPRGQDHRHRVGGHHQAVPRPEQGHGQGGVQLGRHGGEASGAGRRYRGGHRDGKLAAGQQAPHNRDRVGVQHPVDRQRRLLARCGEAAQARRHHHAASGCHRRAGQSGAHDERAQEPVGRRGRRAARSLEAHCLHSQRRGLAGGEHHPRRVHGAHHHPASQGGRGAGHSGVPAQQDRHVAAAVAGTFGSRLIEKIPRVGDIVSFRFERPEAYRFQAGQWFEITFPSLHPEEPWEHHFSHSDAPTESWLEFTTRMRGSAFKNALDALPLGSAVQIEGPYGAFIMPPAVERAAFLAGGIGITCVRSILRWVCDTCAPGNSPADRPSPALREIVLFFANHSEDVIPFQRELKEFTTSIPGFRVVHVLSQAEENWRGYKGHLDQDVMARELPDPSGWQFFVSGPPSFDQAMQEMLVTWGIEAGSIRQERFEGY